MAVELNKLLDVVIDQERYQFALDGRTAPDDSGAQPSQTPEPSAPDQ